MDFERNPRVLINGDFVSFPLEEKYLFISRYEKFVTFPPLSEESTVYAVERETGETIEVTGDEAQKIRYLEYRFNARSN